MNPVKITPPEGYEIDKEKSTLEQIFFKPIENKKPKWEDFGKINGYWVNSYCEIRDANCDSFASNKNVFPTKEEAEACLALSQLCQWRDKYNEGWKPDWKNTTTMKYAIYIFNEEIRKDKTFRAQKVLSFKSEQIRDKFLEDFRELIEIAKPLL